MKFQIQLGYETLQRLNMLGMTVTTKVINLGIDALMKKEGLKAERKRPIAQKEGSDITIQINWKTYELLSKLGMPITSEVIKLGLDRLEKRLSATGTKRQAIIEKEQDIMEIEMNKETSERLNRLGMGITDEMVNLGIDAVLKEQSSKAGTSRTLAAA